MPIWNECVIRRVWKKKKKNVCTESCHGRLEIKNYKIKNKQVVQIDLNQNKRSWQVRLDVLTLFTANPNKTVIYERCYSQRSDFTISAVIFFFLNSNSTKWRCELITNVIVFEVKIDDIQSNNTSITYQICAMKLYFYFRNWNNQSKL